MLVTAAAVMIGSAAWPFSSFGQNPAGNGSRPAGTADAGQGKQAVAKPNPPDPQAVLKMDALLKDWEKKSKTIRALKVPLRREDTNKLFETKKSFVGMAVLERPDKVYLDFSIVDAAGKAKFDERIVCDGANVYQFKTPTRQIAVFPLGKGKQQKELEVGPLPFLFNMQADKAKAHYRMILRDETNDTYSIVIIPLLEIDRQEFIQAFVVLNKAMLLPEKIYLTSPDRNETKAFYFTADDLRAGVNPNEKLGNWFQGKEMTNSLVKSPKNPWTVLYNPAPNPAPVQANGVPAAGGGRQPAMKGQPGTKRQ